MGEKLVIAPDAVDSTAASIRSTADEVEAAGLALSDNTSNLLADNDASEFAFQQGLAAATAFWSQRVTGLVERLVDGAEYMETNAAKAREANAPTAVPAMTRSFKTGCLSSPPGSRH